jgi:hypothetical protein
MTAAHEQPTLLWRGKRVVVACTLTFIKTLKFKFIPNHGTFSNMLKRTYQYDQRYYTSYITLEYEFEIATLKISLELILTINIRQTKTLTNGP